MHPTQENAQTSSRSVTHALSILQDRINRELKRMELNQDMTSIYLRWWYGECHHKGMPALSLVPLTECVSIILVLTFRDNLCLIKTNAKSNVKKTSKYFALADLRGTPWIHTPRVHGSKFFHFHAVFRKNLPNNRLAPAPWKLPLAAPPHLGNPGSTTAKFESQLQLNSIHVLLCWWQL